MKFDELGLCEPLLRSLQSAGYREATPIQQKSIPKLLGGRDMVGCAQTGTGKTAAFALPTLQRLMSETGQQTGAAKRRRRSGRRVIRALILTPTRELAAQIGDSLSKYGQHTNLRHAVIFGGVGQVPQVRSLKAGVDLLVATPGRLLDLIGQGHVNLAGVETLILDEADQMLDMGFIHDLRKIVAKVPAQRQTLMFSATMPKAIRELATEWLKRPFEVKVNPVASTPERVAQTVCFVERRDRAAKLVRLLKSVERSRTLVFARTKHGADKVARYLQRGGIRAISIHGNKSQSKRQAAMKEFNSRRPPVLVATDLASRGLDFTDVSHVINYDLPDTPEVYVHRIGRTARAGAAGKAISFCGHDEKKRLRSIERLTGQAVTVTKLDALRSKAHPSAASVAEAGEPAGEAGGAQEPAAASEKPRHSRRRPSQQSGRSGGPRKKEKAPRKRRKVTTRT